MMVLFKGFLLHKSLWERLPWIQRENICQTSLFNLLEDKSKLTSLRVIQKQVQRFPVSNPAVVKAVFEQHDKCSWVYTSDPAVLWWILHYVLECELSIMVPGWWLGLLFPISILLWERSRPTHRVPNTDNRSLGQWAGKPVLMGYYVSQVRVDVRRLERYFHLTSLHCSALDDDIRWQVSSWKFGVSNVAETSVKAARWISWPLIDDELHFINSFIDKRRHTLLFVTPESR
jgi:hypothetical protein